MSTTTVKRKLSNKPNENTNIKKQKKHEKFINKKQNLQEIESEEFTGFDDEVENANSNSSSNSSENESDIEEENKIKSKKGNENTTNQSNVDKQTSKEAHQSQKTLLKERKLSKKSGEIIERIKSLWEKLRIKKDINLETRNKLINQIWLLSHDNINDLVLKHDASRIVQTLLKYGSADIRRKIAIQLKGKYYDLAKSAYGKYLLVKLLHYGSKQTRDDVIKELHGNYRKLMRHKEGAYVIEDAYRDYASPEQKKQIIREFYGSEFAVFKEAGKNLQLSQIIAASPEKRKVIMYNLRETITSAVNKGSSGFQIIHAAMLEYIKNINKEETKDFIELVAEQIPELVHTNEGSQVACYMILLGNAKERKTMIKSLKTFADELITNDYGEEVFTTLLDSVDDTVLISKSFLSTLYPNMHLYLKHKSARRPFLFLLSGRSTKYFSPDNIKKKELYDELKKDTSKKDPEVRRKELLDAFSPAFLSAIKNHSHIIFSSPLGAQTLSEVILNAPGDKQDAVNAFANLFSGDPDSDDSLLKLPHAGRILRSLIAEGSSGKNGFKPANYPANFKEALLPYVLKNPLGWATGAGSFPVLALVENLKEDSREKLINTLKKEKKAIKKAADEGNKGSKILLEKL